MTTTPVWVAINRRSGTVLTARETRDAARNYVYHVDDDAEAPEDVEKSTDFVEYVPAELLRQLLSSRDADMAWARSAGITLNAVTDILHRYEDANISRGRAVELLRELAVAAVEERTRERDEAVARYTSAEEQIDRLQRGDTIESDFITASECRLLVERDEARSELRALEWLHKPHRDGSSAWFNEHGQPCRYEDGQWVTWSSYAEAATAIGWKDAP